MTEKDFKKVIDNINFKESFLINIDWKIVKTESNLYEVFSNIIWFPDYFEIIGMLFGI